MWVIFMCDPQPEEAYSEKRAWNSHNININSMLGYISEMGMPIQYHSVSLFVDLIVHRPFYSSL